MRATSPIHSIFLHVIAVIICYGEYKQSSDLLHLIFLSPSYVQIFSWVFPFSNRGNIRYLN
jgi:hypothetical protein